MAAIPSICLRCQHRMLCGPSRLRQVSQLASRSIATAAKPARSPAATLCTSRPKSQLFKITPPPENKPSRSFSATARPKDQAILNPRRDEDGNDMMVEITPRAANRLKEIMTTDSNPNLALRITVESGGCHGFQYLMSLTDMAKVSQEEDTVIEGGSGAKIVLDEPSLDLLKGSKVDYTMELIGSQFKITDNPHATSSCGCGTSFDIKG